MSALQELQKAVGSKSVDPLTLAEAANKLSNKDWDEKLSEPTQDWINATLKERDAAKDEQRDPEYPPLEGLAEGANGQAGEAEGFQEEPTNPAPERTRTRARYDDGHTTSQPARRRAGRPARQAAAPKRAAAATGRRRKRGPMSEETKRKIAASMLARKRGKSAKSAKSAKPVRVVATRKPRVAAVAAARKSGNGGELRIVPAKGGGFQIERVVVTTTPVAVVFDKSTAEQMVAGLK